jgi:diaminopimelate epimerase
LDNESKQSSAPINALPPLPVTEVSHQDKLQDSLLPFVKMQGLGNDFVVISEDDLKNHKIGAELLRNWDSEAARLAKAACNRHFGIGADGLIVVRPSPQLDCQLGWSYINSDGSPSDMCGNGLRCVALWAHDRQVVNSKNFKVHTAKGPVQVNIQDTDRITVDLGPPILQSDLIPVSGEKRQLVLKETIEVGGKSLTVTCVSMGNPHCVIFEPHLNPFEYDTLAPQIQALPFFPTGVNVEFTVVENPHCARVFVWERGCGPTLACSTGASAVVVAGVLEERLQRKSTVKLPGGLLEVEWSAQDDHVRLTGPARQSYTGVIDLAHLLSEADRR